VDTQGRDRGGVAGEAGTGRDHAAARVLVVDDNDDQRMTYTEILRRHGYHVREAPAVAEAIQAASEERVDLVLVDLFLTGETGIELVDQLARLVPRPRVIVMTAYPLEASSERFLRSQASAVLHKPFSPVLLVELVADVLQRASGTGPGLERGAGTDPVRGQLRR